MKTGNSWQCTEREVGEDSAKEGCRERTASCLPASVHYSRLAWEQSFFMWAAWVSLWSIINKHQLCSH